MKYMLRAFPQAVPGGEYQIAEGASRVGAGTAKISSIAHSTEH
jgi:hypothetical protein